MTKNYKPGSPVREIILPDVGDDIKIEYEFIDKIDPIDQGKMVELSWEKMIQASGLSISYEIHFNMI